MNNKYCLVMLFCLALAGCNNHVETEESVSAKVETDTVKLSSNNVMYNFSGTAEEMSGSILSFPVGGTVKRIYVSSGQMVSKGTLLAEVDETSLHNAYMGALAIRQQAEDACERLKMLHDNGSLPEIQWIEVQSKLKQAVSAEQIAKKGLDDCKLYAPFSGYIAEKSVEIGHNVLPGIPVLKLVEIGCVKIKFAVPESEITRMKQGMKMDICVPALENRIYEGTITETNVMAHPLSRSYDVKIMVDNRDKSLLPGMICQVYVKDERMSRVVILQNQAIQLDEANHPFVWLDMDGIAQKRAIQTGNITGQGVIVTSGLKPGDKVIVKGQQKISSGQKITTK